MSQQRDQNLLDYIAVKLRELRHEKSLSQQDVLNDTGIHIARIETATINISVSTLNMLCEYYRVSLNDFFESIE